jgi:hypothetical protein
MAEANLNLDYPWAIRVARFDDWRPPRVRWGRGPWQNEPDLVEWRSKLAPYPLMIIRGGMGVLCGYIGVPPSHPLHGKPARKVPFEVVNWVGPCEQHRIPTGDPPDCWWLGFDCGGGGNYSPVMESRFRWASEFTGRPEPADAPLEAHYVEISECRDSVEWLAWALQAGADLVRRVVSTREKGGSLELIDAVGDVITNVPKELWEKFKR